MSEEDLRHQHGPGTDGGERVVVVGLIATPPDHPARVAERLSAELADLLAARVDDQVRWEVRSDWGAVAPRRDGGLDALLDDVAERREAAGWDIAICLTDLPLQVSRLPLVAHCSLRRRAGLVSLPALGLGQLRATRAAVLGLVEGLATALVDDRSRPWEDRIGGLVEEVAPVRRVVDRTDDGEIGFVSSRVTGIVPPRSWPSCTGSGRSSLLRTPWSAAAGCRTAGSPTARSAVSCG
jgi:hypothetical protein